MKVVRTCLTLLVLCLAALPTRAQIFHYDSLAANLIIPTSGSSLTQNALGLPDTRQASIGANGNLDVAFLTNGSLTAFNEGSTIHIYWAKESGDSTAANLTFMKFTDNFIELARKDTILIDHPGMVTVHAPAGGFNALDFSLTGGTDFGGSKIFYLDAVTLIQSGTAAVKSEALHSLSLTSYPNPFTTSSGTTVSITSALAGKATLHIYNMLGREVQAVDMGMISSGTQELKVVLGTTGVYVARLSVDGSFVGEPLKITAE